MTSPVSPHDPLCPSVDDRYLPVRPACQCPLIERVKDREGERYDDALEFVLALIEEASDG